MVEPDSDDEHEMSSPTPPQWKLFEQGVQDVLAKLDPAADVRHDTTVIGDLSGTPRQIDVLITGTIAGQSITIVAECKHYKRRLGIGAVDEFAGKLLDIAAERGILYALNGLTGPALGRAAGCKVPRIAVGDLSEGATLADIDFGAFLSSGGFGDCPNVNCFTGDIGWYWWSTSESARLRAGSCDTCGTWCAECPECGELIDYHWNSTACPSCATQVDLIEDRKGGEIESIEVTIDDVSHTYSPLWESALPPGE
jgi:Restriction endonuclease